MKILRVGDMHVKPNNLKESKALIDFILFQAEQNHVDRVEFLGDQYDTHGLVRLEVLKFWTDWFFVFSKRDFKTVVLVGNHDVSGNYSDTFSALQTSAHLEGFNFKIVHEPYLDGIYGYLPYIHDNNKFVEEANKLAEQGAKILVSHPNYEGAVYDNGSSITGGVRDNSLSPLFVQLIGGHIHTELELGRIWYTGNPRWLTKNDANKRKGIWLCEDEAMTGRAISRTFISTESVCTPIISLTWKEGQDRPEIPANAKVDVELVGSSDWVQKQKLDLKGVSISSKITDIKKSRERKSGNSLYEFLSKHYQGDSKKLISYLEGLNLVG